MLKINKIKKVDRYKYYNFLNSIPKKINRLYFKKLKGNFKLNNKSKKKYGFDPVTNIDKAFEFFLRKEIIKKFPNDGIIGEEFKTKKSKSGYTWVIDPIDGTRSFIIGSPTWSNLISVNYKNEPTFGLANFPILRKYYITGPNNFSYLVENKKFKRLKVLKSNSLVASKIAGNFFGFLSPVEQKKILKLIKLIRYPCSDALSYCQLCEGKLNVVLQCYNKIWDIHPLIPIIKNAGGHVSTWKNKDAKNAGNIVACSSTILHKKIIKMLKPVA
tara:strand:+ start:1228 stop:2043 length:816 start_codon:yes stop_codon:yes gene_type:complete